MSIRVRFAPSPTGFLHIGGARTALFNWLYARKMGGTFVLRIEDTDVSRNTQEAVEVILNGLRWLGLDWDEGPITGDSSAQSKGSHGPYFQSQRRDRYQQRVEELISKGMAYTRDGAVRFKMTREPIVIPDIIVGDVRRVLTDREELDPDFVIVRSDGMPVFHFVNVVDDLEMGITHVIRGEDHLSNSAKHIALFRAFGVEPPRYGHIPLILNPDGTKMSKRDQGALMTAYMDGGFAPEAVVNYLCLLGWSPKDNREVMSVDEVVKVFDLPQVLRHNAKFDMTKLLWLNGDYIRKMPRERYYELCLHSLSNQGIDTSTFETSYVTAALDTCREKIKVFDDARDFVDFYFKGELSYDPEAAKTSFIPENKPRVKKLRDALAVAPDFSADAIGALLKAVSTELGVKTGVLVHPTRLACTGKTIGPSLYHLMEVLGRERVLARLDKALAIIPD